MTLRILIVDDRADVRETLRELIELHLPDDADISVEDTFPLDEVDSYASFIREHDVAALLLDERLNEVRNPETGIHVPYLGHDVVGNLRSALPDFPVYVVTTFSTDSDLVAKESEFEDVINRDSFRNETQKYTNRIQRAASRFRESMQKQLKLLDDLTMKAAHGQLDSGDQEALTGVRQVLGLPFSGDSFFVVSDLIAQARALALESENLVQRIKDGGQG